MADILMALGIEIVGSERVNIIPILYLNKN